MKFVQFSFVLSLGIIIGLFVQEYHTLRNSDPDPKTETSDTTQTINNDDTNPPAIITDKQYPHKLETDVKALRKKVAFLEQTLKEQQQTNKLNSKDESDDNKPVEKLSKEVLIQIGVTESIAEEILSRLSQFEYGLLELHDRAEREGYLNSSRYSRERNKLMLNAPSLQKELGKDNYDNYLYKTEQNNRVSISTVMMNSPAEQLGVKSGDIILNYANEKILSWQELRKLTRNGVYGEYVNLNILRDGKMLNILVPRGPLGVQLKATKLDPLVEYNY